MRRVAWRLIPFLLLCYVVSFLDRVNVSFAALQMNRDLGFNADVYGTGAGLFFITYCLFEVPSNLILFRVGASRWIARIMFTWGLVAAGMAFISGPYSFYAMRLLLGVAEAGFFPGIIFFLSQWFPAAHRAKMVGLFMIGMPLSGLIGAPISTSLLDATNGLLGYAGWQWMFVIEGVPSVLLGVVCFLVLPDRAADAHWLTPEQRRHLQATVDHERRSIEAKHGYSIVEGLTNRRVLALALLLFLFTMALNGSLFWIPQIVKTFGVSNATVGWLTAIPYFLSVLAMVTWSRHSDAAGERVWHITSAAFTSATGFVIASVWLDVPIVAMCGLSLGCIGIYSALPIFWSLPTSFLTGPTAAGAIALITASGNLSGIVAPALIGWSKDLTNGFGAAMLGMALAGVLTGCLCLTFRRPATVRAGVQSPM
jgi:ACS family tartrate transporter-like MFS transporter